MADAKGVILGMLAETPLHPGAGQSADVVDLPVAREGATGLPHIPETGLKGALKQWAETQGGLDEKTRNRLFGTTEVEGQEDAAEGEERFRGGAGELLISTARLLCLPVRRLDSIYAWVTTPYLLERLKRDSDRLGLELNPPAFRGDRRLRNDDLLVADGTEATVFLEEYCFTPRPLIEKEKGHLEKSLGKLVAGEEPDLMERLLRQIAVMADEEFAWFAENALPVDARNQLDDNKVSMNLWYEETIPPDALFYSVILPRGNASGAKDRWTGFFGALQEDRYLQVGGNETVGQGWVRLRVWEVQ